MDWENLLSTKRTGQLSEPKEKHDRTQFQRDYDRLIFSSPFRRMQNKTQVFPLPGSIFVHNRLTHSLEVACVGRSLGNIFSDFVKRNVRVMNPMMENLGYVVSAACLAHDIGNPPFGHSGEKAISQFFKTGEGKQYEQLVDNSSIWKDFTNFEGNANTFRLLTHQFAGRRRGGFALTYTTIASVVKYPHSSDVCEMKKYGFFQSEKETFIEIAKTLGIKEIDGQPGVFSRHPLVFLVEAADDICYQIMDIEDAHKLGILHTDETKALFLSFFDKNEDRKILKKIYKNCKYVTDDNEQIAYFRAVIISHLVNLCSKIFCENQKNILNGNFSHSLIDLLDGNSKLAMQKCIETGYKRIYRHQSVVEIEIAGYKIIYFLLKEFINAILKPKEHYSGLLLPFIPTQFKVSENEPPYRKIQTVIDFVAGMTDNYALDLYKKISGNQNLRL